MPNVDFQNVVLAFRTPNALEARAIVDYLADAGIESHIVGDFVDGLYPGVNLGRMGEKEIWVAATDEVAAASHIGEWRRLHHADEHAPKSQTLPRALWIMWILALLWLLLAGLPTGMR